MVVNHAEHTGRRVSDPILPYFMWGMPSKLNPSLPIVFYQPTLNFVLCYKLGQIQFGDLAVTTYKIRVNSASEKGLTNGGKIWSETLTSDSVHGGICPLKWVLFLIHVYSILEKFQKWKNDT